MRQWRTLGPISRGGGHKKILHSARSAPLSPLTLAPCRPRAGGMETSGLSPAVRSCSWLRHHPAVHLPTRIRAGGWRGVLEKFSCISTSKGGLSTAIEAGVDEVILFLQSGHGKPLPARAYMHFSDLRRLLETFEAFGL
jgi:hypothetical protein